MKKRAPLSIRQLLLASCILTIFLGMTALLFSYKRDEKLFNSLSSRLFEEEMTASTLNMHYTIAHPENFGIHDYKPMLPLYRTNGNLQSQAAAENFLAALDDIRSERLSESDAYTYTLLMRNLENSYQKNKYTYYNEPLSPSSGMQTQLPILLAEYAFRSRQDVADYLSLLDQTDEYFASLLLFEQEKAANGLLMPASSLDKVIRQCNSILTEQSLAEGAHFLQTTFAERLVPLKEQGKLTAEEVSSLIQLNHQLLCKSMLPAYQSLAEGLSTLKDDSTTLSGLAARPEGQEYYKYLWASETGSFRSIEEAKELLTAQLEQELAAIRDLSAQYPDAIRSQALREEGWFPYRDAAVMLADLQERMQEDFPSLPSYSSNMPGLTVKVVDQNLQNYCAPAFYLTAPLDDTDNNVIYINPKSTPTGLELYTTLAHEGYPGHLYQTVYSNRTCLENDENPLRQLLYYGGYVEGWALYVEFISYDYASELMRELGRSQDAVAIQFEKHSRSLQLCLYSLLDIMIHYENASYQQIAQVLENFGIGEASAATAIYSYIAEEPCNYPKYYFGYTEILELQKTARQQWGADYSDYEFHRFYLDCGPSDFTSLQERLTDGSGSVTPY